MGYRAMEFSHSPRWSCNLMDVTGALTAHGYLHTSKMYSPIFYVPNADGHQGFAGELYGTVPGEPTRKITGQNIFPPEDLGNQMVMIQYRAGGDRRSLGYVCVFARSTSCAAPTTTSSWR